MPILPTLPSSRDPELNQCADGTWLDREINIKESGAQDPTDPPGSSDSPKWKAPDPANGTAIRSRSLRQGWEEGSLLLPQGLGLASGWPWRRALEPFRTQPQACSVPWTSAHLLAWARWAGGPRRKAGSHLLPLPGWPSPSLTVACLGERGPLQCWPLDSSSTNGPTVTVACGNRAGTNRHVLTSVHNGAPNYVHLE